MSKGVRLSLQTHYKVVHPGGYRISSNNSHTSINPHHSKLPAKDTHSGVKFEDKVKVESDPAKLICSVTI